MVSEGSKAHAEKEGLISAQSKGTEIKVLKFTFFSVIS